MHWIVLAVGALALAVGVFGLIRPHTLAAYVRFWGGPMRFRLAVGLRLVVGALLILAAPQCKVPMLIRILGGFAILAGIVILIAGRSRLDETVDWWLGSDVRMRSSALFATVVGGFMVWAAW